MKRAQEQAAREGQGLHEVFYLFVLGFSKFQIPHILLIHFKLVLQVIGERHGSLGELVASVRSNKPAHSRAHLHAIQSRRKGLSGEQQPGSSNDIDRKVYGINLELLFLKSLILVYCEV